jgi:subtilisin family serine protease
MKITEALPDLKDLHQDSLGEQEVVIAILDGPVALDHPALREADLSVLDTLVKDPPGNGLMSRHGTHVTSLIFGQPGSGVLGVAPGCRGLIIPVFHEAPRRRLPQLDLARAIEQAVRHGAHVINISGGQLSPTPEPNTSSFRCFSLSGTLRFSCGVCP